MMQLPFALSSEQNMPAKSPVTLRMVYELVQSIDARTSRLEVASDRIDATLHVLKDRFSDLEQRVASIEVRLEVLTRSVEGLIQKMDILTDECHSISAQLKARFDRMEADRLENRVSLLESKVSKLENSRRN
jgi:chromosome segregation ATPase